MSVVVCDSQAYDSLIGEMDRLEHAITIHQELARSSAFAGGGDSVDITAEILERTEQTALGQHLRNQLQRCEDALRQLERDGKRKCQKCNKEIEPERLRAIPYTTLCSGCSAELSRRQSSISLSLRASTRRTR